METYARKITRDTRRGDLRKSSSVPSIKPKSEPKPPLKPPRRVSLLTADMVEPPLDPFTGESLEDVFEHFEFSPADVFSYPQPALDDPGETPALIRNIKMLAEVGLGPPIGASLRRRGSAPVPMSTNWEIHTGEAVVAMLSRGGE